MDIHTFVRQFVHKPASKRKPEIQFAVLAFDLGVDGANLHPPPLENCVFSDEPRANSPSGPWCSQTNRWSPALEVRETREDHYHIEEYGESERIHAEAWLMGGLVGYLRQYARAYGRMPGSVSLYTEMSPCPDCTHYLQRFPPGSYQVSRSAQGTVPHWILSYREPYLRPSDHSEPQPPRFSTHTKDGYGNEAEAVGAANSLASHGWTVVRAP